MGPELYVDLFSTRNMDFHFKHALGGFRALLETLQYVGYALKLRYVGYALKLR
jgi:hypothetical protein